MTNSDIKIILSSDNNYEKLVAEIYHRDKFVALMNQDKGREGIVIEFPDSDVDQNLISRKIELTVFAEALDLAKRRLLSQD